MPLPLTPDHVNLIPSLEYQPLAAASKPPNQAIAAQQRYRLEPFLADNAAYVLLCRPELLDGPLDARLLLLQTLQGIQALHSTGRAHGRLSLSSLLLFDRQCVPPPSRACIQML